MNFFLKCIDGKSEKTTRLFYPIPSRWRLVLSHYFAFGTTVLGAPGEDMVPIVSFVERLLVYLQVLLIG